MILIVLTIFVIYLLLVVKWIEKAWTLCDYWHLIFPSKSPRVFVVWTFFRFFSLRISYMKFEIDWFLEVFISGIEMCDWKVVKVLGLFRISCRESFAKILIFNSTLLSIINLQLFRNCWYETRWRALFCLSTSSYRNLFRR